MKKQELSIAERIELVRGKGNWHTNDLDSGVDSIHLSDGPHGLRAQREDAKSNNDSITATCFPTACASACSFNRALIEEMSAAIAIEAQAAGVSVLLGPGVNMKRSPLCGRNFEYFSEDPYLAGEIGAAYVKGVQKNNIATSLKHFAGNNQECHRMTANSMIDERALREIYLRAFEKVVKDSEPATIMASYNQLNGVPACENKWLLSDVLREEWNYKGLVMSDWGACVDAGACIEAGLDLEMPDSRGNHTKEIQSRLNKGTLSKTALIRASDRVIDLAEKYSPNNKSGLCDIDEAILRKNYEMAVRVALESAVLMKNEGALPLKNPKKVVVIGDLATQMRIQGGGSSHIKTGHVPAVVEILGKEGIQVSYYKGYDSTTINNNEITKKEQRIIDEALLGLKTEITANPEVPVLIFGGLTDTSEGEGYDRTTFSLPLNQVKLYRDIRNITENVIFISFGGAPYDLSCISFAQAILNMYLDGEGVAQACVDLILGKSSPSGRLAETWPEKIEDTPCYKNFGSMNATTDDVAYCESLYIGYRYYDTFNVPVNYPFGHGLSYSEFKYEDLTVLAKDEEHRISVKVTNVGNMAGYETILVFVKNPNHGIIRANRELRAFSKVYLTPGQDTIVEMVLDDRSFKIFDKASQRYVQIGGEYEIEISKSVGNIIMSQKVEVTGEIPSSVAGDFPTYFVNGMGKNRENRFSIEDFKKIYEYPISDFTNTLPGGFSAKNSLKQMAPYSKRARLLLRIGKIAARIMTGKPLSDSETRMMYEGISEGNIDSVCNQSGGIISKKMIDGIIASANK